MAAGDKEIMEAYKDVIERNVTAAVAHGNDTRKLLREAENKVKNLDDLVRMQQNEIANMKKQLAYVQAMVFKGGTSGT